MKKKKLNEKLSLSKKVISNLNDVKGGKDKFTRGCSDGCTPLESYWNCTRFDCTNDCGTNLACDLTELTEKCA